MKEDRYIQTLVTIGFLNKIFKKYTQRMRERERNKNSGMRKERITKIKVCNQIIKDMQNARLI